MIRYPIKAIIEAFLKGAESDIPSIRKYALKLLGPIALAMVQDQAEPPQTDPPYILTNLVSTLKAARQHCPEPLQRRIDMALHGAERNGIGASPPEPEMASFEGWIETWCQVNANIQNVQIRLGQPSGLSIRDVSGKRVRITVLPEKGA